MSLELGQQYNPNYGSNEPIEIPDKSAPQNQLAQDSKIEILVNPTASVDTFKVMMNASDSTPDYLFSKFTTSQFVVDSGKIKLYSLSGINVFSGKTTDDLTQGSTNLYLTSSIRAEITENTASKHSHSNKTYLDTIDRSGTSINIAVDMMHQHSNHLVLDDITAAFTTELKAQYDAYTSGVISSVTSPLNLNTGVLSHLDTDGNKHIPTNSGINQYYVLTAGSYGWTNIDTVIANSTIFEAAPSTSITKGVQSAYIKALMDNTITDKKLVTDANLTYINTTIPSHIASALLHVPSFTPVTDRGKFLYINSSDALAWSTSSTSLVKAGTGTYVSVSGDTVTVDLIDITDTNITAGTNISIVGNVISSTQRPISSSPSSGASTTSISSSWAYTHSNTSGAGSHIPTGGTSSQYVAGDGTIKDFSASPGGIFKISMPTGGASGSVVTRIAGATVPTGWSLTVGTTITDLVITHDVAKGPANVKIWTNGTTKTMLVGNAGYSTVIGNSGNTKITIVSLATINEAINIYIQFE